MKRFTLVLALAALSVPAAAGATQTPGSQHSSSARVHAGHIKITGTVRAVSSMSVTVANAATSKTFARGSVSLAGIRVGTGVEAEGIVRQGALRLASIHREDRVARTTTSATAGGAQPGDDRGGRAAGAAKPSDDLAGDDRGGLTGGAAAPGDDPIGDDHGRRSGLDDGPSHQ
jgi:hypothetical protein